MARKPEAACPKLAGAQADMWAQESKRGHGLKKDDVVVKIEEEEEEEEVVVVDTPHTKDEDSDEIDDLLDYVEVKLEDLELDDMDSHSTVLPKMEDLAVPKAGRKKKRAKKNKSKAAKVKPEGAAPETDTNTAPAPETKGGAALEPKEEEKKGAKVEADFFSKWDEYFGKRELADWQRLCRDLGLPGDLPSKTQCRKALETVHVNIRQFLDAMNGGGDVKFFQNVRKLAWYTRKKGLWMPKRELPKGDPLGSLRRQINRYF